MPNSKPGDHPLTDLLVHGKKLFPQDMEALIRKLRPWPPIAFADRQSLQLLSQWELGEDLDEGRL